MRQLPYARSRIHRVLDAKRELAVLRELSFHNAVGRQLYLFRRVPAQSRIQS
jgi:hypothetical protein